jgi:hypothetical protein
MKIILDRAEYILTSLSEMFFSLSYILIKSAIPSPNVVIAKAAPIMKRGNFSKFTIFPIKRRILRVTNSWM